MKMNKLKMLSAACLAAMMLLLAACGGNSGNAEPTEPAETNSAAPEATPEATEPAGEETNGSGNATEIYEKAIEAATAINSLRVDMTMNQDLSTPEGDMKMDTQVTMDLISNPLAFKNVTNMTADGASQSIEMYYIDGGIVMLEPQSGQWIKLPQDQSGDLLAGMNTEDYKPSQDMERLKQFSGDFTVEETDTDYLLKLSATGEKFNEFVKEEAMSNMGDMFAGVEMDINVEKIDYTFTVNKETYLPVRALVDMDFTMTADGEEARIVQQVDAVYSNINEIQEIVLPEEAKNAEELQM